VIPEEGAAFLAPLFGNWAGKDDITKYFFKDTPLAGLEQQMMTPPNSHTSQQAHNKSLL